LNSPPALTAAAQLGSERRGCADFCRSRGGDRIAGFDPKQSLVAAGGEGKKCPRRPPAPRNGNRLEPQLLSGLLRT
jgi:hypothetical protein